jgi:hypothetical protein
MYSAGEYKVLNKMIWVDLCYAAADSSGQGIQVCLFPYCAALPMACFLLASDN